MHGFLHGRFPAPTTTIACSSSSSKTVVNVDLLGLIFNSHQRDQESEKSVEPDICMCMYRSTVFPHAAEPEFDTFLAVLLETALQKADYHQDCATGWAMAGAAGIVLVGRRLLEKIKTLAGSTTFLVQSTDITS